MGKIIDITGNKYDKILVTSYSHTEKRRVFWNCQCDCGVIKKCNGTDLKSGKIKSCGCTRICKHNFTGTRIYSIWKGIKSRCYIVSATSYHNYGGRGISVCDEWKFNFINFKEWSFKNGYTDELTIERIDFNGNYEPKNCTWITKQEQGKNKRQRNTLPKRNKYGKFTKNII